MNYKQLVESSTPGEWKTAIVGYTTGDEIQITSATKKVVTIGWDELTYEENANARLICHHKRHFDRLVEALKGLNMAYNQGRMPNLEERTACRLALADADKVED